MKYVIVLIFLVVSFLSDAQSDTISYINRPVMPSYAHDPLYFPGFKPYSLLKAELFWDILSVTVIRGFVMLSGIPLSMEKEQKKFTG